MNYTTCWMCQGTGQRFDITLVGSAVARESDGVTVCSHCNGSGVAEPRWTAPVRVPSTEPIGEIPDWMLE